MPLAWMLYWVLLGAAGTPRLCAALPPDLRATGGIASRNTFQSGGGVQACRPDLREGHIRVEVVRSIELTPSLVSPRYSFRNIRSPEANLFAHHRTPIICLAHPLADLVAQPTGTGYCLRGQRREEFRNHALVGNDATPYTGGPVQRVL